MRNIVFETISAFEQFNQISENRKIHAKIIELINDIQRHPFNGIGKPEPLKYDLTGFWARRISQEHRLVYKITEEEIIIVSCKFHYQE
ncbi:MAG: Txe/YoeB family addiction module toxin [Thiotrichaceae bacterium]